MNKILKYGFLASLFLLVAQLPALELGASYRMGNLSLNQIEDTSFTNFNGMDFSSWGLNFWGSHMLTDKFSMDVGFYTDPILKKISYTLFSYSESFLSIGVGPFFGFFNDEFQRMLSSGMILKSGISTSIRIEVPSILFMQFRTDSTLASRLVLPMDYIQERTDISLGFYLNNAVCSLNIFSKKFTQKETLYEVVNALNEYSFVTHLFQKNIPYRITLKFAYQNLSKQFIDTADNNTSFILNSIIVGTRVEADITDAILFYIDMDNNVYSFGQENLKNTSLTSYAFRGSAGIQVNLDNLWPLAEDESLLDF